MNTRNSYNQYSLKTIRRLVKEGAEASRKFRTVEEMIVNSDYSLGELEFVCIGFHNPDFVPGEAEVFYRIGEPRLNRMDGCYARSYNYVEDRPESGVSVVTTGWLRSMKSVFFGATDDKIADRGVWKVKGLRLPSSGGDDEILIIPVDWAEKTRIKTRAGLERAVKKLEEEA